MKKLFLILVLCLMWSGSVFAGLFGSNNKVKFYECYDPSEHKNFKSFKNSSDYAFDEWSIEIDFKKNNITRTIIWSDKEIAAFKKMKIDTKKIDVETFQILSSTSDYVVFIDGNTEYTLNVNNGDIQIYYTSIKKESQKKCTLD